MASPGIENPISQHVRAAPDPEGEPALAQALMAVMQDGLIIARADGSIAQVNDPFCRMTGFEREDLLDHKIPHPFWPQDQWPAIKAAHERVLAGEKWRRDFVYATRQGQRLDVIASAVPLQDGYALSVKDVSPHKRAAEMAQLAQALRRSNQELDQFAYVTSHDLKAPLRGIANLSRWIEEDLEKGMTADVGRMLELMRGRVDRMESLIVGLLEYSRIGRVPYKTEQVDTVALVREVVDLLDPPPGFTIEIAPDLPAVPAPRVRLQQVFMNLIANAIRHHHRKSGPARISVTCGDGGERHYEFRVTDDGPGIDRRYHDRIFVIFQTLEARDTVEGTGLGLSLVKKIVEGAGGTVRIESELGKGSAFVFTWPRRMTPQGLPDV